MADVIITVRIPEEMKFDLFRGEVDGFEYVFIAERGTNRLLFDANETLTRVRFRNMPIEEEPMPEPEPEPIPLPDFPPVHYEWYHVIREVNVRALPNANNTTNPPLRPPSPLRVNTNIELSTEIIDPNVLVRLGLPADTPLEPHYRWRAIKGGNFVATYVNGVDMVKVGTAPNTTSSAPSPLIGKNLKLVTDSAGVTYLENGKGMGANLRELIHWGDQNVPLAKYMNTGEYDKYFAYLRANNFKWVRFYVFHRNVNVDTCIARTRVVLDKLRDYGLLGCVVFMDSLAHSGFTFPYYAEPRGNLPAYHRESQGHLHKSFYHDKAWQNPFQPAMEKVVTAFKGHTGVGMWQIINEPGIYPQPSSSDDASAVEEMLWVLSARIYAIDKSTPISGGFISTHHFAPTGVDRRAFSKAFWSNQPNLHLATVHAYQDLNNRGGLFADESYMHIDFQEARSSKRATGITEFGSNSNRGVAEKAFLERLAIQGDASLAIRWALSLSGSDDGIGDKDFGWHQWHFGDFEELQNVFEEIGGRL